MRQIQGALEDSSTGQTTRRNDIDWLRVLGMLTVFLFHCGRFFDTDGWHVKIPPASQSDAVTIVNKVVVQWMMPLFFVLSGMSAYYSLERQTWRQFVVSRVKRLAVPLLFGIFVVIAPLQVYLERVSQGQFHGSFWAFYPHYFDGWYAFGGNFAWMGIHLWYLEVLFCYSLLALPLFLVLRMGRARGLTASVSRMSEKPGTIFLLAIPIIVAEAIGQMPALDGTPLSDEDFGGWSLLPYLAIFTVGYFVATDGHLADAIRRHRFAALAIIVAAPILFFSLQEAGWGGNFLLLSVLRGVNCWAWLVALGGFAATYMTSSNRFLRYANEAVLPFYILHQTIILTIGFYVIRLNTHLWVQYLIIMLSSFAVIMATYELLVKRLNLVRILFGMKPLRRLRPTPVAPPLRYA